MKKPIFAVAVTAAVCVVLSSHAGTKRAPPVVSDHPSGCCSVPIPEIIGPSASLEMKTSDASYVVYVTLPKQSDEYKYTPGPVIITLEHARPRFLEVELRSSSTPDGRIVFSFLINPQDESEYAIRVEDRNAIPLHRLFYRPLSSIPRIK